MMTDKKLLDAIKEAKRFIKKAEEARARIKEDDWTRHGSKENGAAKRASLDLTRALADFRGAR